MDAGATYAQVRTRIAALVGAEGVDPSTPVPACPGWTVKDVVAHLSGVCSDILNGRLDGVATDPWTAKQVDDRRDWTLERVLEEWAELGPQVEAITQHFPPDAATQLVTDLVTHEHDLRAALNKPGERDAEPIAEGLAWLGKAFSSNKTSALRLKTPEGDDIVVGSGDATASVTAPRFELFRAVTGRRSADQIAAFEWEGDYREHLDAFNTGPFTVATSSVNE